MLYNRRSFVSLSASLLAAPAFSLAAETQGRIETLPAFHSDGMGNLRIRAYLPPSYDQTEHAHRTLYMLDGQYAFAGDSNGTNSAADRRVAQLIEAGTIKPTIIVAVDHLEDDRFLQYMPQTIYDRAGPVTRAVVESEVARVGASSLQSAQFVQFLKEELKPFVDATYRVSRDRLDTAIFGASMAGVMAGAIFVEAQQVFGRAACMSPNWAVYDKHMIDEPQLPSLWAEYFSQLGPPAGQLWLDHGTQMMDAGMRPHQAAIANALGDLGWQRACNLQTRVYDAGHAFAETAFQMDEVLAWLLA